MGIGPTAGPSGGAPATVGDGEEDGRWRSCDFVLGVRSFEGAQRRFRENELDVETCGLLSISRSRGRVVVDSPGFVDR
ncbi:hypothetical protein U1Q18_037702 [Sarracenia purpurea var. burkii]